MKSLGDRIKKYELCNKYTLTPNSYIILRVDGKAFHTFTRKMEKPYDDKLINAMIYAGKNVSKNMQGFILGYHQSDEFTFLITDTQKLDSQMWFDGEVQKINSITASLFTAYFNNAMGGTIAAFDCRVFIVPKDDVPNVFVWRQQDWERNSIQMLARSHFSHNEMQNKNISDLHEMLHKINVNWTELDDKYKNGTFLLKNNTLISRKLNYNEINEMI